MQTIRNIEGIGETLEARFNDVGIRYVEELLALPPPGPALTAFGDALEGVTPESLEHRFVPQARFMQLKGCDGQLAEGLANSGIRSFEDLVIANPDSLMESLQEQVDAGTIPTVPASDELVEIQLDAAKYAKCGNVIVYLSKDAESDPDLPQNVEGQIVTSIHPEVGQLMRRFSDGSEMIFFKQVFARPSPMLIRAPGYERQSFTARIVAGGTSIYSVSMKQGDDGPLKVWDEFNGDVVPYGSDGQVYIKEKTYDSWDDMPKIPPLIYGTAGKNKTLLHSAWLIRRDNEVEIPVVRVPNDSIPQGAGWQSVFTVKPNGELEVADITAERYRELFVNVRIIEA